CVFFFQAEDGIRDWSVTGVQTCALPICQAGHVGRRVRRRRGLAGAAALRPSVGAGPARTPGSQDRSAGHAPGPFGIMVVTGTVRSEERRVGEEWRGRWAAGGEGEKGGGR